MTHPAVRAWHWGHPGSADVTADADTGMAMALSDGGQDYRLAATGGTSGAATTSGRSRWPDQVVAHLDHGPPPYQGCALTAEL